MKKKRFWILAAVLIVVVAVVLMLALHSCDQENRNGSPDNTAAPASETTAPGNTPEVTPEVTPEITPEATPESTPAPACDHAYAASEPHIVYEDDKPVAYAVTHTCEKCGATYEETLTEEQIRERGLTPIAEIHDHRFAADETEITEEDYRQYLLDAGKTDDVPAAEGYVSRYFRVTRTCEICGITETVTERRDEPASADDPSGPDAPECSHVYEAKVTEPTCENRGYSIREPNS